MQPPHGDTEILYNNTETVRDCWIICISAIGAAVITTCVLVPFEYFRAETHYYVTIDSVSDLNPAQGLSFNLTLGVASWSHGSKACIKPGTYLEVSYRDVQLAITDAELTQVCAGPRKSAERHVMARVTAVSVGHVLDRLSVDMKQGEAMFDVTLHVPAGSYDLGGTDNWLSGCNGIRVGAAAVWCDAPCQEPGF
ncbi:unnamed protein product [Alopecurus aequalis]